MNIFFNDKKIKISALDSEQTINEKISLELNTLPKYLFFPDNATSFSDFKNDKKYIVEDLLNTIKEYVSDVSNYNHTSEYFTNLCNSILPKFKKRYNILKDVVRPFIVYNTKYIQLLNDFIENNNEMFISTILNDSLFQSLKNMNVVFSQDDITSILINHKKERQGIENEIKAFKIKEKGNDSINTLISKLKGIHHTDFLLEENILNVQLDIPKTISLLDLFNFIELNPIIQFASCKKSGFYKIFGDFIPPEHWIKKEDDDDNENSIIIYVLKQKQINKQTKKDEVEVEKDDDENEEEEEENEEEEEEEEEEEKNRNRNKRQKNYKDEKLIKKIIKKKQDDFDTNYVKVTISETFNVVFDFNVTYISKEYLMNAFVNIFPKHDMPIINEYCSLIRGMYDFPNKNLNKTVFRDLILTNPNFIKFININESKGIPFSKTTIYFNHESTGEITASLIEQKGSKYKNLKKSDDDKYFSDNSYIQVHITKCKNIESVRNFQFILSRLLEIYYNEFGNISKVYRLYIKGFKDFTKEKKNLSTELVKSKELENLEPSIFMKGEYIRNVCQKYPKNIDDDYNNYQDNLLNGTEIDENNMYKIAMENNKDILIFPSKEISGFKPRRYICDTERNRKNKHLYPGLKENKLKNNNIFKYLPCCFPVPQKKKLMDAVKKDQMISKFFQFEGDDEIIIEEDDDEDIENNEIVDDEERVENKNLDVIKNKLNKHQQDKIKTNKFVKELCSGMLPPKLNILFENVQNNDEYTFYRFGVKKSPNSFIDCIQTVHILSPTNIDNNNFWLYTEDLRKMFSGYAPLSKQENFDKTIRQIKTEIKDVKSYFNPLQYVRILEEYYKYNIFLFIRNEDNTEYMSLPHHKDGYYKKSNKNKCVFIYIHGGSESDISEYPQCEIIALSNNKIANDVQCEFDYDSEIAQRMIYIYNKLDNINYLDENIDYNLNQLNLISQNIDEFGKTRVLNFKLNNQINSLFLQKPIYPLNLPIDNNFYLINNSDINDVIQHLNLEDLSQRIIKNENNRITELNAKFSSISVMIYFNDYVLPNIKKVREDYSLMIGFAEENYLGLFNLNKKIAAYLLEYFFWMYSNYIYEQQELNPLLNIEVIDQDLIMDFVKTKIKIDNNFSYYDKELKNSFSYSDSGVIENNRLVLKSTEFLKRLTYFLRIEINRNFHNILNYRNYTFLQYFYSDVEDFEQFQNQVILKDQKFVLEWIANKENNDFQKYTIYDTIYASLVKPYFFRNSLISKNTTYLAQNTNSFEKALKIAVDWIEKKYNVGYYVEIEGDDTFDYNLNLFSYVNSNEITKYIVNVDHPNNYKIKIIGYKIDGDNYFTTLLTI